MNIDLNKILETVDKLHVSSEEKAVMVNKFNEIARQTQDSARQHEIEMQQYTQTSLQKNIRAILALMTVGLVLLLIVLAVALSVFTDKTIDVSVIAMAISLATIVLSFYFGSAEKELKTKDELRHEAKMERLKRR